ncbi:NPCBM/NEW2 domain-containing protein [Cellulomonas sp. DKR-3]|uniref:NPCBM/NEW2 domain-containing protein n=1 Tax=Cellulomonas fulva TaxID=2835530 RepID=A0ABS5TWM5_9CELL|nr:NPCBM/NEW2 domain-containing protein [Cellulomonas fulva]MBT0993555.1 NPCBM/NEW2 domain-containing protein [Cellulomonas fulva]
MPQPTAAPRRRALLAFATVVALLVTPFAATSAAAAPRAAASLSITKIRPVNAGPLVAGEKLKIAGTASGSLVGHWVKVQRLVGKKWVPVTGAVKVTRKKTFGLAVKASGKGATSYRVVTAPTPKVQGAVSKPRTISTYRWLYLADLPTKDADNAHTGAYSVNGRRYAQSIELYENYGYGYVSYDLKRKCVKLASAAGVSDDNDISVWSTGEISLDGQPALTQTYHAGTTYTVRQDVTDVLQLDLAMVDSSDGRFFATDVVYGNARVLCRF